MKQECLFECVDVNTLTIVVVILSIDVNTTCPVLNSLTIFVATSRKCNMGI